LKVVLVTPGITEAGIGIHVRELARALNKRGVEVVIYTVGSGHVGNLCIPRSGSMGNIKVKEFYGINPPSYGNLLPRLYNPVPHPNFVNNLMREDGIFHIHGNEYFTTVIGSIIAKLKDKPFVLTIHNVGKGLASNFTINLLRKLLNKSIFKMVIRSADVVIAPTTEAVDYLKKFEPRRIEKIRLAIDLERFKHLNNYSNHGYVLYLGRLEPVKGVELLIKAVPFILRKIDIDFVIAGYGSEREKLESLVNKMNLSKKVKFLGHVPYEKVPNVFAGASVFYGGRAGGYSLLEAAAARKPIICIEDKWSKETIGGSKNAFFIPYEESVLAKAIVTLFEDESFVRNLTERTYRFVKEHASWAAAIDRYLDVYESLLR